MILEIKLDKSRVLSLYINGKSEDQFFDYSTRVEALRLANMRFDNDLMTAASLYPNEKNGAFLWCYTSEFLRGEEVTYLVKIYYLLELIKIVLVKYQVKKLILRYPFPKDAITELFSLGLKTIKSFDFYAGKVREVIKIIFKSADSLFKNGRSFFKKKNSVFRGNLLDVNQGPTLNRLDSLNNFEFYTPYKVFSGQEHRIIGFDKNMVVVFRNENTVFDGIRQFYRAVILSIFIKQNSVRLPRVYRSFFKFRDVFKLWSLLLYERGTEKYFKRCCIKNLVHVSSLNKPEYRILWTTAQENNVKVTIVASRTFKYLSSSDRFIEADVKFYSKVRIPNNYIVRDQFSKEVFKSFQFYDQVKIGARFCHNNINKKIQLLEDSVVYFVLTHIKKSSQYLLSELKSIDFKHFGIQKIYFRNHPSLEFTTKEIQNYFPDYEIINHTGISIHECNYEKIIMISGPSTGALELIKEGVTLFWFPYIWKDGILFDDIMDNIGYKVDSINSFLTSFFVYNNDGKFKCEFDNSQFKSSELISSALKTFL